MIPRDEPFALLDFPHFPNVGDSIIWLGVIDYLRRRGMPAPRYTASNLTFSADQLRKKLPSGTNLITGGGNFGDLYPTHQSMREQVATEFRDHRLIQLPQSLYFTSDRALDRARRAFGEHPSATIITRDDSSHTLVKEQFDVATALCPDMAFAIEPLERPKPTSDDVIWLSRRDKESTGATIRDVPSRVRRVEWVQDEPTPTLRFNQFLARQLRYRPIFRPGFQGMLSGTYEALARERTERGCRTLGAGSAVITDRLHGHILCLLLGIPHFVLDNTYGKVRGCWDAWTSVSPLGRWCDTEEDALRLATLPTDRSPAR